MLFFISMDTDFGSLNGQTTADLGGKMHPYFVDFASLQHIEIHSQPILLQI